jgi:NTE family protein
MKTGLALSGGGVRGIAHIGVIKALEEQGIYPSIIAGTSAGAIIGALYAGGCSWEGMLDFFKTTSVFSINKYARSKPGFVDTNKFYDAFKAYFPSDSFESLNKSLYITATNILDGTLKVFHDGELIRPILASAAFPGLFSPVRIKEGYYVDGGIINNFPVDIIKFHCDQLIGTYVNSFEKVALDELRHTYSVIERAYKIQMARDSLSKFKDCDLIISPEGLRKYRMFSLSDMDGLLQLGYTAAKDALQSGHNLHLPDGSEM